MEHGGKGARAVITDVERDRGNRLPRLQLGDRRHQPHLLPPGREARAGLSPERAGEGPPAHRGDRGPRVEIARIGRIFDQHVANAQQAWVLRHRQVGRRDRHAPHLGEQQPRNLALAAGEVVVRAEASDLEHQRTHELRHLDHPRGLRIGIERGIDVERVGIYRAAAADFVIGPRRNPDRPARRQHEHAVGRFDHHHARGAIRQLRAWMVVRSASG